MNTLSAELFEELWNKYNSRIYFYFRRQFDETTAEDLCQQTYLNAWRHISSHSLSCIHNQKSWLFAVAKNVKNDYLRYVTLHSVNFNYADLYENETAIEYDFAESMDIQKAINMLSKEEQELLSMAEYLTSKEISSVLGISASATRSRIQKVKEKLKAMLYESGIK